MEAPNRHSSTSSRGFWATLREAIAGSDQDFTEGSLGRAVILLAIPMVLEMAMESLFGILDVFFVGKLGPSAEAAVGLTETMMTVMFAIAVGLGVSVTALVARRIGEKDPEEAAHTAVQALALGLLVSLPFTVAGIFFADDLLRLLGAGEDVVAIGSTYTQWVMGGNVTVIMLFLINAIFRGAGDASLAMRSLWLANGVNIVLDPILIFGLGPFPELGITGAAIGTTVGRAVGVAYQLRALMRGPRIQVHARHMRLHGEVMGRLLRVSLGGILQFLISTASWIGLVLILTPFGTGPIAGYTIAVRIMVVAILPSWGMCNAASTLVGQNLGAKKPERAERAVWLTGFSNMVFLGVIGLVFIFVAEPLLGVFIEDPLALEHGAECLRIMSYGYIVYAWGMVMLQAFNGAGDTATPTWINFFCYWLVQIPLAYVLAKVVELGPLGVYLAIPLAESLVAAVSVYMFRRGTWKTRVV